MFESMAVVNFGVATAYVVIGAVVIPQLRLRPFAAVTGIGFFLTCALTHAELGVHALTTRADWLVSSHMWAIHLTQLVVDWGFIAAMAPWRGPARARVDRRLRQFVESDDSRLTPEEHRLVDAVVRAGTTHAVTVEEIEQAVEAFTAQKRLEQRKDEFVAYASHELRTPAAVVYGAAQTLLERGDGLSEERRRELVAAVAEQSERLRRLIDQLLDLSRYENGDLYVELRPVRLRPVLEQIAGEDVRLDVAPDLVAHADEGALERVVGNLLANARRYGEPPVTVSAQPQDGRVVVAVEDRGEGVPAEFVPALFTRFTRAHADRHPGGAGLGLAIAAAYTKALGGELSYAAASPTGARFELTLERAT
jgi:signal transduction histidine kinase